jgi:acyl dehydratase
MVEESMITQELKDLLGKDQPAEYFEVEKDALKIFARAIGDPNPVYSDPEYAKKTRYGAQIAPPTFLIDYGIIKLGDKLIALIEKNGGGFINGGTTIDFLVPIKVGDTIKTVAKLIDLKEKVGSNGKLLFMTLEVNYFNQKGELARKCRDTFISPQRK